MSLLSLLLPELILIVAASGLLLLGLSNKVASRRLAPVVAMLALIVTFCIQIYRVKAGGGPTQHDTFGGISRDGSIYGTLRIAEFAQYIKLISLGIGILLTLLAWPTNDDATGNSALHFGHDAGEFFALMLLSLTGLLLVAGANDIMLLFLGIELASIPTYIMVSVSRPLPVAQEAGVKYFFLGAFAAAIMLFGFSYLYGTTGATNLYEIMLNLHPKDASGIIDWGTRITLTPWQSLAVLMLVAGFAFKMAVVPLHFYVGDVYQGAATPVTAFLSFVPKASGFVALIKLLFALGGPNWLLPEPIVRANGTGLLWVLAILTMTVGNVLGLLQYNVKRVLAFSSVAHSGYMMAALAALATSQFVSPASNVKTTGLQAVLFYLAAYGIMNIGAFGVLQLLSARDGKDSAETFEDLAGKGRHHVSLALSMAVCCFSLTGIPLTVGFMGKLMIIKPALAAAIAKTPVGMSSVRPAMTWLVVIIMINAAISAAYYLRIVATLFLRSEEHAHPATAPHAAPHPAPRPHPRGHHLADHAHPVDPLFTRHTMPILLAVILSVAGTLLFGMIPSATELLGNGVQSAARIEGDIPQALPGLSDKAVAASK
ncbi:MAG: proton-translocating NADH-quinone oxidoreductase, chain [Phycisphaerales bacterium]|nr:proton-translocating NADH-quinone oxidoreductase, chain [Phycisphaerales bacterium]